MATTLGHAIELIGAAMATPERTADERLDIASAVIPEQRADLRNLSIPTRGRPSLRLRDGIACELGAECRQGRGLHHDPATRELYVWTPPDWAPDEPLPLLVDLKGYWSSALAHANWPISIVP